MSRFYMWMTSMMMTVVLLLLQVTPVMAKPIQDAVPIQKKAKTTVMDSLEELEEKRKLEEFNLQMGLGLSDELRDAYSKLLLENPDNSQVTIWVNYRLAEYDYSRDRFEEAIKRLEEIITDVPNTPVGKEATLFMADIIQSPYNPNRNEARADEIIESLVQKNPDDERIDLYKLSRRAQKQMEKDQTVSLKNVLNERKQKRGSFKTKKSNDSFLEKVVTSKFNEDLAKIMRGEASLLVSEGKYDEAYAKLEELLHTYSGDNPFDFFRFSTTLQDVEYQKALILIAKGQQDEAKQELGAFIEKYPTSHLTLRATEKLKTLFPLEDEFKITSPETKSLVTVGTINPDEMCVCGPVALRVALKEMGHTVSLTKLIEQAGTNYNGTTMAAMAYAAKEEGFTSVALRIQPTELEHVPMPSILLLPDHYVTVTEVKDGQATIYDSLIGWNRISVAKLSKQWDGYIQVFASDEKEATKGLSNVEILTLEKQQVLKGRYLCGNTGGSPGGGGEGSSSSDSTITSNSRNSNSSNSNGTKPPTQCGEFYAFDIYSPAEDEKYAREDADLDNYGMGGGGEVGCRKAKPNFEQPDNMADGYMDGIISSVNRIYGNHNLMTPILLLRGSQYTKINYFLTYNSQASTRDSMVGLGWNSAYGDVLSRNGLNVEWVSSDGRRNTFTKNVDNTYTSPPGVLAVLTEQGDGSFSLVFPTQEEYLFNVQGKLERSTDERGQGVFLSYDNSNRLNEIKDSYGLTVGISYGENNKVSELKVNDAHYIKLNYDATGHLIGVKFPDQTQWMFGYSGFLTTVTDRSGRTTSFEYNSNGQTVAKKNANGNRRLYGTTFADYAGSVKSFEWDGSLRVTAVTDSMGKKVKYSYNADNKLTSVSDLNGAMRNEYDTRGNITSATDALGHKIKYVYDLENHLLSTEDALGRKTTFTYDKQGNVLSIEEPKGRSSAFTYDSKGQIATFTNPGGKMTHYEYDETGRLTSITGPLGRTVSYTYDDLGRKIVEIDAEGNQMQFAYDFFGHIIQMTYPGGLIESEEYSGEYMVAHTDRKGNVTRYEYDAIGRITKQTDPDGAVYLYEFDTQGRNISTTDPRGNKTKQSYNARGQITKIERPGVQPETFSYDEVGRLTSRMDVDGLITTYTYDAIGRVISEESK